MDERYLAVLETGILSLSVEELNLSLHNWTLDI